MKYMKYPHRDSVTMPFRNEFLLTSLVQINGHHIANCFCVTCRNRKKGEISVGMTQEELSEVYFHQVSRDENIRLNSYFIDTMKKIIHGKAHYDSCLRDTHYRYFGRWLSNEPSFSHLTESEKERFSRKMNQVNAVFNDWETIVSNLTDERMVNIDARKFSIYQFYRARMLHWCIDHNELHRNPGRHDPENPDYSEDKFRGIMNYIHQSRILEDINHDPSIASAIGRRIQNEMTRLCTQEDP